MAGASGRTARQGEARIWSSPQKMMSLLAARYRRRNNGIRRVDLTARRNGDTHVRSLMARLAGRVAGILSVCSGCGESDPPRRNDGHDTAEQRGLGAGSDASSL